MTYGISAQHMLDMHRAARPHRLCKVCKASKSMLAPKREIVNGQASTDRAIAPRSMVGFQATFYRVAFLATLNGNE
jgi:hypothetical protein